MNNSNTPGFIVAGAVNHLRWWWWWCVCKENIITGSMTLRRGRSAIIIIVRKDGQISCVYLPAMLYSKCRIFSFHMIFCSETCFILFVIFMFYYIFFFQDVLNKRLEERTDEMVERGLIDELCQFKNELSKITGTDK